MYRPVGTIYLMRTKRNASETKSLIIQSCFTILRNDGAKQLTLQAVAEEAGISKGGLLYHYPSKETLITAIVNHQVENFDKYLNHLIEESESAPGRWIRSYATATTNNLEFGTNTELFSGLFAASDEFPQVHDAWRKHYEKWQERIENSRIDPVVGTLLRLAIDGLWFSEIYQYGPPSPERRKQVLQLIRALSTTNLIPQEVYLNA